MPICKTHGEYEAEVMNFFGLEIQSTCPICEKEEIEAQEIKDQQDRKKYLQTQYRKANIEPMYFDSTLENLEIVTPEHQKAIQHAKNMIRTRKGKLVLVGTNGTGKTHIASAIVKWFEGGAMYTMFEIGARIRATYAPIAKETELEVINELSRIPLLTIDEIGRTKGSEAELNWLSEIINKRHVRNLPIILISNRHPKKSCTNEKGCDKCLENYIGEDITSRLYEDGHLITLTGDDYRRKKRLNK